MKLLMGGRSGFDRRVRTGMVCVCVCVCVVNSESEGDRGRTRDRKKDKTRSASKCTSCVHPHQGGTGSVCLRDCIQDSVCLNA